MRWRPAYIGLGSNLDGPARQITTAVGRLRELAAVRVVSVSGLWASPPLGPQDQPDFVNAAAGLLTTLEPRDLLAALQGIEIAMGREPPRVRWGPRVIDLDLLAFASLRVDEPGLRLPHPGLHERDFVLYPLAEIAPLLWIEGQARVRDLRDRLRRSSVRPFRSE